MATPIGFKHAAETRAKMSAAHKKRGYVITPEQREKMVSGQRKAAKTPEYREAVAQRMIGKKHSAETKAKMSAAHKGKIRTPEHCANISKAKKGIPQAIPQSPAQREKNRRAQLGNDRAKNIKYTPELKEKRSAKQRKRWLAGVYDHKHPCWGAPGVHAGTKMHCLNSEGVFAKDLDDNGIQWLYEPRRFKLSWCTYKPDFYLPEFDIWVEVKGYLQQPGKWREKIKSFREETGKTLIVVFQSELSSLTYKVGG